MGRQTSLLRRPTGLAVGLALKEPAPPPAGGFAPFVGSPAPRPLIGRGLGFTGYRWRGTLHHRADVCLHNAHNSAVASPNPYNLGISTARETEQAAGCASA